MGDKVKKEQSCKIDLNSLAQFRSQLPAIAEEIIESCNDRECYTHVDYEPIPSRESVIEIIDRLREILFPGYFARGKLDPVNLRYSMGESTAVLFDLLSDQISRSIRHECIRYGQDCTDCAQQGHTIALRLLKEIPSIRKTLATDVQAAYEADPAARSYDEIIFSYPGIFAITVYRVAHKLFEYGVPLLPRIMTEYAHSITGIDIHPGAAIDESFVIDHGTGVVIGETTRIGRSVRIYQGVTLGALSIPKDSADQFRGKKRHPTIEDDVIIYSGATILGGDTIIGTRSVIGGNVWLTESVPADTTVVMETPRLNYKSKREASLKRSFEPAAQQT
ncbi:MAG: serine acetyltransferase [Desulfobacterales bacterium]|nr:MAG: serine acetyltransferase [Desulfobacterales bacterium]